MAAMFKSLPTVLVWTKNERASEKSITKLRFSGAAALNRVLGLNVLVNGYKRPKLSISGPEKAIIVAIGGKLE